ncbi:MAG: hypothetical protein JSW39_12575, partial [Desulfobacterales bacterium]
WHIVPTVLAAAGILGLTDLTYAGRIGMLPNLGSIWWLAVIILGCCGCAITLGAGGANLWKRVLSAGLCGTALGVLSVLASALFFLSPPIDITGVLITCIWRVFAFPIFSIMGMLITEIKLPEPELN